jgi:hypothetical protein
MPIYLLTLGMEFAQFHKEIKIHGDEFGLGKRRN